MDTRHAQRLLDEIHLQTARCELFRGYRSQTVAFSGLLGIGAAVAQPWLVPDPVRHVDAYLKLWIAVAVISLAVTAAELSYTAWASGSGLVRQKTRRAVAQFGPCLLVGGAVTACLTLADLQKTPLLPGLWAICFSLGIFSSRFLLPPAMLAAAIYYALAGCVALCLVEPAAAFSPWTMGTIFGGGQLLTAFVLFLTLERPRPARRHP